MSEFYKKYNCEKLKKYTNSANEEYLRNFYENKIEYINNKDDDSFNNMQFWYEIVYTNLKLLWVNGRINENTFRELTEFLKEGL